MWHILEKYNRRVAQRLDAEKAKYLEEFKGGKAVKSHQPNTYKKIGQGDPIEGNVVAYISSEKPIYNYPLIEVVVDGQPIIKVTRKEDAFRIMHALKRDYQNVVVRIYEKDDS